MEESPSYKLHKLIFSLDQEANKILKARLNMSYKRILFLVVLRNNAPLTQHQLAAILGYSDAAVSLMLTELKKSRYVSITPSPDHGRKMIVRLTDDGEAISEKASIILDEKFALLGKISGVDLNEYSRLTEKLYNALAQVR